MNREPEEANAHNMVARCCQYAPKRMKCASRCVDEVACSKSFGGHPAKHSSPETRDLYICFRFFTPTGIVSIVSMVVKDEELEPHVMSIQMGLIAGWHQSVLKEMS